MLARSSNEGMLVRLLRLIPLPLVLACLGAGPVSAAAPVPASASVSASTPPPLAIGDTWPIAAGRPVRGRNAGAGAGPVRYLHRDRPQPVVERSPPGAAAGK